jgi:DNA-damage-inducible protein J
MDQTDSIQHTIKQQAEGILAELGLRPHDALNLFYTQVVLQQGLPFKVTLPLPITNSKTINEMLVQSLSENDYTPWTNEDVSALKAVIHP